MAEFKMNLEATIRGISIVYDRMNSIALSDEILQKINNLSRSIAKLESTVALYNSSEFKKGLQDIVRWHMSNIRAIDDRITQYESQYKSLVNACVASLAIIENSAYTDMLASTQHFLKTFDYDGILSNVTKTLSSSLIESADISFLKLSDFGESLLQNTVAPKGLATVIRDLNKCTAIYISKCEDISYEVATRKFVVESDFSSKATAKEMNVICSGAEVLNDGGDERITTSELMSFLSVLENTRTFASQHKTGQKIHDLLREDAPQIDFDSEEYYHARALGEGTCPYTYVEMLNAPIGVTGPGRFNYPGQSYYYFSDSLKGAVSEIRKHACKAQAQVAIIRPIKKIRLLDLSGKLRGATSFLKYIRFDVTNMNSTMPREYLLPCFVSDCCRALGFDGIKYYGAKDYNNYVSWDAGFFTFINMVTIDE